MYNLVHKLIDGPLDIVGDIHGEIDALKKLLDTLGYDENGYHPYGRKLIFVGDLVDRGPNSIAVVNMVRNIIGHGNGQCILGNHELNIMMGLQREGNGWFFGSPHDDDHKPFNSVFATEEERSEILAFFKALPLALESDRLRVVHACWDKDAIEKLTAESGRDLITLYNHYEAVTDHYLTHTGISHKYSEEQAEYREAIKDRSKPVPFLPYTAKRNMAAKMFNHIKTLTSGPEKLLMNHIMQAESGECLIETHGGIITKMMYQLLLVIIGVTLISQKISTVYLKILIQHIGLARKRIFSVLTIQLDDAM